MSKVQIDENIIKRKLLHHLNELTLFLGDYTYLIQFVNESGIKNKSFFRKRLVNFYDVYIKTFLVQLTEKIDKKELEVQQFLESYEYLASEIKHLKKLDVVVRVATGELKFESYSPTIQIKPPEGGVKPY
jgi:hypothetical protein